MVETLKIKSLKLKDIVIKEGEVTLKIIIKKNSQLITENRDDFDYYAPIEDLEQYSEKMLFELQECVDFSEESRDPSKDNNNSFLYVEISAIDSENGEITNVEEIPCDEEYVPSRARKVIHQNNIIISTVRPTRKAIAIIGEKLENQICSTGFCVIQPKKGIDLHYLHYILRSDLVLKQFKRFQSGSSYPAILKDHIQKTIIPLPEYHIQQNIGSQWMERMKQIKDIRLKIIKENELFIEKINNVIKKSDPIAVISEPQKKINDFVKKNG